jgi:hypothetical protein
LTSDYLRPIAPPSQSFQEGDRVYAMWCALGDSNGKGSYGRLLPLPEHWLKGTVMSLSQDMHQHPLYGVQFDRMEDEDDTTWDNHIYKLYSEYIVPIVFN